MDIDAWHCPVCRVAFNSRNRNPYQIPCGHSLCEHCLTHGTTSHCDQPIAPIAELHVNSMLKGIIEKREVPCAQHSQEIASHFCMAHLTALCEECLGSHLSMYVEDSPPMDLSENEAQYKLQEALLAVRAELKCTPAVIENLRKGKVLVREMVTMLVNFYTPIRCVNPACQKLEVTWLNPQGPAFSCCLEHQQHYTDNGQSDWVELPNGDLNFGIEAMCKQALYLLSSISSVFLQRETFALYRNRMMSRDPIQLVNLLRELQADLHKSRTSDHPLFAQCLMCEQPYSCARGCFYRFDCSGTEHQVCINCASHMIGSGSLICPVDGESYKVTGNELESEADVVYYGPNFVPTNCSGEAVHGEVLPVSSGEAVTFTELPGHAHDWEYIELFPSVIPALGTRVEENMGSNRGWYVDPYKNPVETIVLGVFKPVNLLGFMFSAPLERGMEVTIDFIKIYVGSAARGEPFKQFNDVALLVGGDYVAFDVMLPEPVLLENVCTLKLKLSCQTLGVFVLYRGNSFKKVDLWTSSCNDIWDFEDCRDLDPGEYPNGQCNNCGPFLRFYYTQA